jgi:hypothetical protein
MFVALAAVAFSAAPATADTILYQDTFNRGTSGTQLALNGSAPTYAITGYGASASAVWTTGAYWTTDGTEANVTYATRTQGNSAFLPFTPQAGYIYTFSSLVACTYQATAGHYIGVGFTSGTTLGDTPVYNDTISAWQFFRNSPSNVSPPANQNGCVVNGNIVYDGIDPPPEQFSMILNTNPTLWTVTFLVGANVINGPTAFTTNPTINYLAWGVFDHSNGTVQNVTLSVNVQTPEPSTLALLLTGLAGLLAYAWRKRR